MLIELNIPALGPSQPCQFLPESPNVRLRFRVTFRIGQQDTNPPHLMGLLRAGRERPSQGRAADQRDELAAPHSITSSARASSVGGMGDSGRQPYRRGGRAANTLSALCLTTA